MFYKISSLALVLSAVSSVLASPLSPGSYQESTVKTDIVNRQFACPPGLHCGPGPACVGEFCDLPGCADAEACQDYLRQKRSTTSTLVARQFACPTGANCGHGPECAGEFCDLPACADAALCQDYQRQKRNTANSLVDRQFECPPGADCGHGPVCTADLCDLSGCADAEVCQGSQKRSADTDIVHPTCDICIVGPNGNTVCGCATPSQGPQPRGTDKACPLFCITTDDGDTLCGCEAEDYEKSKNGGQPTV